MDGLSGAASLIAVIQISAQIASLCFQYSAAVKDAKKDIERLQGKVADLRHVLDGMNQLLDFDRRDKRVSTVQKLASSLKDCCLGLEALKTQLDPGKSRTAMRRLGLRALKWPFTSKEVDKILVDLERYEQIFVLALQVDQTGLMLDLNQKMDVSKLPIAKGASFDSHMEEHNSICLGNTRVELQQRIAEWARDRNGHKPMFWLNGMAGTGKSTIARTVAKSFSDKGQLGASFFFKKGEDDRGNAARFFTTIATDLMCRIPDLMPSIRRAINADPAICERALKSQFEKLILQPFSEINQALPRTMAIVVVIDALDECDREEDIREILRLLSQAKDITSVWFQVFLTSRPELPIRLGFKQLSNTTYQDLVLHEVPKQTIEKDITLFLQHELEGIREQRSLSPHWPSEDQIQALVQMTVPLFIFAATACRYVGDNRGNPKKRLDTILQYQTAPEVSKLDKTYLPILNQLFNDVDEDKEQWSSEFRDIVGSIIVLESPLSIISLAELLDILKEDISCRLDLLHSVLSISMDENTPVRLLHLSFRDFLLDPQKRGKCPFWVDERETHERITSKCLQLMSSPKGLRQNMCNLSRPGTPRSEIDQRKIDCCLQPEIQYACRYWVHHLKQSENYIRDNDSVDAFLQKHFIYWLEAMSLIGKVCESIHMINSLQSLTDSHKSAKMIDFLRDAKRFTLQNRSIIEDAPLQLYSSALIFAPEMSVIRNRFNDHIPRWITTLSKVKSNWNASLQTLEGHSALVNAVVFSPHGQLIASASEDSTIRLWDVATGFCRSTLQADLASVGALAFSPDSQFVKSASNNSTARLWDATAGLCLSTLKYYSQWVGAVAFSPDSQLIAFSPNGQLTTSESTDCSTVWLQDAATGCCRSTLKGHSSRVRVVIFSPNGQLVASGSKDSTVRLWDVATGFCRSTFKGHSGPVCAVAFSPDGQLIASGSEDSTVRLWDAETGFCRSTLKRHSHKVTTVAFSPDGHLVASGSVDRTVRLWDVAMGFCRTTFKGHSGPVRAVAFSPDGQLIASGSNDSTVRLWDAATEFYHGNSLKGRSSLKGHSDWIYDVAFSPNGQLVASGSEDSTVRLWDAATGFCSSNFKGHSDRVENIVFSPDGQLIASGSDDSTVRLWDTATRSCRSTLEGHSGPISGVAFSPDGQLIASGSIDSTVRLWGVEMGICRSIFRGHSSWALAIAFSPDSQLVASGSIASTVRLWDAATGVCRNILNGHSGAVRAVAFSPDGQLVASASVDSTVRLWDAATGSCHTTLEYHSQYSRYLAFSSDGSHLVTKSGRISLPSSLLDDSSCQRKEPRTISVNHQWVISAEQRLLRLPTDYRATCFAARDNSLWLGHSSGHITILVFDLEYASAEQVRSGPWEQENQNK